MAVNQIVNVPKKAIALIEKKLGPGEYIIASDGAADRLAAEQVVESLWAFKPEFLAYETSLPEKAFQALQNLCEDAQPAVLAMVQATCGVQKIVESAIRADGRGHFLAGYDGEELEFRIGKKFFYAYRTN